VSCPTRKIIYASRQEAITATRYLSKGPGSSRPYRCPQCGNWHMGRKLPKHAQRALRRYLEGRFEDERGTK
jgi:hypothetical protein